MRATIRRCAIAAITTALTMALLPVGASAATPSGIQLDRAPAPTALPDGAVLLATPGGLPHVAAKALAGSGELRAHDLDRWLTSAADLAAERLGADPVVATTAEEEPEESGSYADATELGDVNGDGASDVLVYNVDLEHWELTLEAVSGRDGSVLWSRGSTGEGGGFAYPLGADIDGDAVADLVGLRLTGAGDEACTDDGCVWEETFTWTLALVSGADGAAVWHDSVDGFYREEFTSSSSLTADSERWSLDSENFYYLPFLAGDGDGDGLADLGVNAIDLTYEDSYEREGIPLLQTESSTWRQASATRAAVRSGRDGGEIYTWETPSGPGMSVLLPGGDLLGSAPADLLWEREGGIGESSYTCSTTLLDEECSFSQGEATASALEAYDGATGQHAWTVPGTGEWSMVWPIEADLNGDGSHDLMRFAFDEHDDGGYVTQMLDGATGAVGWATTSPDDWLFPVAMTQLDGDGGLDLITAAFVDGGEDTATIQLDRLSGATGVVLSTSAVSYTLTGEPSENSMHWLFAYVGGAGDLDGDAGDDVVVGFEELLVTWEDDDDWGTVEYLGSAAQAQSGRTGAELLALSEDHPAFLDRAGDLDGNGTADLFEVHARDGVTETHAVRIGAPALWSRTTSSLYSYLMAVGDQDGVAGDEVVAVTDAHDSVGGHTMVESLEGTTGARRWGYRSRP